MTIADVQAVIAAKGFSNRLTAIEQPGGYATLYWQGAPLNFTDSRDGGVVQASVPLNTAYDIFNGIPTLSGVNATNQLQIVQQLFRTYYLGLADARGA